MYKQKEIVKLYNKPTIHRIVGPAAPFIAAGILLLTYWLIK